MLGLIALTVLSQKIVDFSHAPERLDTLLPSLGKVMGKPLATAPSLRQEVVVLHVEKVQSEQLLEQIAKVVGAEWIDQEGTLILTRSTAKRAELDRRTANERANRIRASLVRGTSSGPVTDEEIRAALKRIEHHNSNIASWSKEDTGTSMRKLLNLPERLLRLPHLAAALPWEDFAQGSGRTVFSDNPTRMQVQLPKVASERLADVYRSVRTLQNVSRGSHEPPSENPYRISARQVLGGDRSAPTRTVLAATVQPSSVLLTLSILDSKGALVRFGTLRADPTPEFPKALDKIEALNLPYRLDRAAQRMTNAYGKPPAEVPADLKDRAVDPLQYEPLGDSMQQAFQCFGRDSKMDIVALVPDFPTPQAAVIETKPPATYRDFLVQLNEIVPMKYEAHDGWFLARPQDLEGVRASRLDRYLLGKYLDRIAQVGTLPFDELAQFAYQFPTTNNTVGPVLALRSQALFTLGRRNHLTDWQTIRFWGSLSKTTRRHLLQGTPVAINSLSNPSRLFLETLIFKSEWGVQNARFGAEYVEPTDYLPAGLPVDTTIHAVYSDTPRLYSPDKKNGTVLGLVDPWQTALREGDGLEPYQYQPARLSNLEILIRIAPTMWFGGKAVDHLWIDRSSKPTDFLSLPRPILREIVQGFDPALWEKLPDNFARKLRKLTGFP